MKVKNIYFGYDKARHLFNDLCVEIPRGKITTIIGPNGCGKSTLLSLLTKGNKVIKGEITLDDINIDQIKPKAFAKKVAVLHQHNNESLNITVRELVGYGRTPHQDICKADKEGEKIIDWALAATKMERLQGRVLSALSGGQRQRAWLAMALCQQPEILFLDEPTTYLDMYYQMELLNLVKELNETYQMTIVMVLHDINQAIHYSDHIIVMKSGKIIQAGKPSQLADPALIEEVYQIEGKFHEESSRYFLLPLAIKE